MSNLLNLGKDGAIILDLRSRRLSEGMGFLENFGEVSTLVDAASGSAKRVLVQKA